MIARISGILIQKSTTRCVVDVNGTGYGVVVPLTTFYELPDVNEPVVLHIHTHVREDAINLFGFNKEEDKEVFELMISVSGIGPKLAVNILSGIAAREWVQAVTTDDLKRLTAIPGIGKKTAERMILELKEKALKFAGEAHKDDNIELKTGQRIKDDALSALVNLGYKASLAKDVVDGILKAAQDPLSLDQLLKQALRILAG